MLLYHPVELMFIQLLPEQQVPCMGHCMEVPMKYICLTSCFVHIFLDFLSIFYDVSFVFLCAFQAVLKMLSEIGSVDKIPEFLEGVKNR